MRCCVKLELPLRKSTVGGNLELALPIRHPVGQSCHPACRMPLRLSPEHQRLALSIGHHDRRETVLAQGVAVLGLLLHPVQRNVDGKPTSSETRSGACRRSLSMNAGAWRKREHDERDSPRTKVGGGV